MLSRLHHYSLLNVQKQVLTVLVVLQLDYVHINDIIYMDGYRNQQFEEAVQLAQH